MKNENYGAPVECGVIESIENGKYRVASYSRDGIVSPPIKTMTDTLSVGDRVYFFMFDDGNGMILARM